MTIHTPPPEGGRIVDEPMGEALSRRYLAYALSTITNRALPDVRDGFKPVHRRILYAMHQMRLNPQAAARKCAKVVGEVMGGYHPHGDASIYDALVRLAQDFAQRYPLVDGQGNFGNIDGDNAAAMRYTECKLTAASVLLMEGIDQDSVDFRPTYDDQDEEPTVLPAGFPNLLANGSSGIAVGMATSIPPHNVGELIDACLALLDRPETTTAELAEIVPGPDFPTGGVAVEGHASILDAYETGRGGVRLRARWEREPLERGGYQIVITEVPYQVQKSKLIEALAELIEQKKAPLLGDVRDESAEDIRVVIDPKSRNIDADSLMESLFRLSDLEVRFPINMNVLDATGTPRVMGLKACLQAFLDHRREVLNRRSAWRIERVEKRLHLLEGLRIVFLNLDEVIRIVREEEQPKAVLIARFGLSETQADFILDTRLRQLARIEEMTIENEYKALSEELASLQSLTSSPAKQWKKIGQELAATRKALISPRRTTIAEAVDASAFVPAEAFIPREAITVILSERGWIRAVKGKVEDPSELKFKEGDALGFLVPAFTTDKLLVAASDGRVFTVGADKLASGRGHGEPLRLMVELEESAGIVAVLAHQPGAKLLIASKAGYGFIAPEDELLAQKRGGKQVLNGDLLAAIRVTGDHVVTIGENLKTLIFKADELPEMGRGKGVKLQSFKQGGLTDIALFDGAHGPEWVDGGGRRRNWPDWKDWLGKRAGAGRMGPRGLRKFR
ncbi:DNA topoisomerase IV subunit A [Brevundimonas subvibrioides]|uniref:DNA topoisomerase 4 subunit A n=1 Tax=Brevundimonas subvibrioides (strain ATCC 15264 / DSM 4735 / LMG 14903 / NBRC 16000 / CB 81) TaxID=633149 RepID=D9QI32_BRESC|nr:DNA topoisomerase IV subunit A [Brevundimonas subvibrioides]ADL01290.1 DNA topoisomerase IV, A subunit [Brevundimonas subvibrioides ATCC 15264]